MLTGLAAPRAPELRVRLGPERDDELSRLLRERTRAWALAATGTEPLRAATIEDVAPLAADHAGRLVIVAEDVPRLAARHLDAILDDLDHGVHVVLATGSDGRPFLLALDALDPQRLALLRDGFEEIIVRMREAGLVLGMLGTERRLASLDDARAVTLDPLSAPDLSSLLAGC